MVMVANRRAILVINRGEEGMAAIKMQFSADEAFALMRALAIARRSVTNVDERDDLEVCTGSTIKWLKSSDRA